MERAQRSDVDECEVALGSTNSCSNMEKDLPFWWSVATMVLGGALM